MRARLFGDFPLTSSLRIQPFREEQGVRRNKCIRRLPNSIRRLHSRHCHVPIRFWLLTNSTFSLFVAPRLFSPNCFNKPPRSSPKLDWFWLTVWYRTFLKTMGFIPLKCFSFHSKQLQATFVLRPSWFCQHDINRKLCFKKYGIAVQETTIGEWHRATVYVR